MAESKFTYYMCYDIVKTPINPKTTTRRIWAFKSVDYDHASKYVVRSARSNFSTDYKTATLFTEDGYPMGWAFRTMGEIVFVSRSALQSIGLMSYPKRK